MARACRNPSRRLAGIKASGGVVAEEVNEQHPAGKPSPVQSSVGGLDGQLGLADPG